MTNNSTQRYWHIVDEISAFQWHSLSSEELVSVAWLYYFFSVQFRESLNLACDLFPQDEHLILLRQGECDTDNLSPFPGIAAAGERMHHDEFVRRLIGETQLDKVTAARLTAVGERYLKTTRHMSDLARAKSIASYEDGGLECVFRAILRARDWRHPGLPAFHHFLTEHIRFDSDPVGGHGALSRHLIADNRVVPLWAAFRNMLLEAIPQLQRAPARESLAEAIV